MEKEYRMVYSGRRFLLPPMELIPYQDAFFEAEIELESELFYELRKRNGWLPHQLKDSSESELSEIKEFFQKNSQTFFFLFEDEELIGSILFIRNYIQSLSVARRFQRQGFGSLLTCFATNKILDKGFDSVELKVFADNAPAISLYEKLGFKIIGG